jgi:hypothetical protein
MEDLEAGAAVIITDNRVGPACSIPATKDNKPSAGEIVAYPRDIVSGGQCYLVFIQSFSVCKRKPGMCTHTIVFVQPNHQDVVGTRRRTWSHHPGNVYYRELVSKTLAEIMDKKEDCAPMRMWAIKIVDHVMKERESVFLKADEQNGQWHVMDYAAAVNKSAVALRNAEIKQRGAKAGGPKGGGAKKKGSAKKKSLDGAATSNSAVTVLATPTGIAYSQDLPPIKYLKGSPPEKKIYLCVYEAKQGPTLALDPYCKAIINLMCRQTNAKAAAAVLDIPVLSICKTAEEETDKQRLIRLQLRQRYIASMTIGMSPVVFSKKLMELWGGSITSRHAQVDKNGNFLKDDPPLPTPRPVAPGASTTAPPVAASTTATTVPNKEAIPNAVTDKPTEPVSINAPPSAVPIASNVPQATTTPQSGTTPASTNPSQVLVKEDVVMSDAAQKVVSLPSTRPVPEGSVPMEVDKPVQGTITDATMIGEDPATAKKDEPTDREVKTEVQVETEKIHAVTTSLANPVTVSQEEPPTLEAAAISTQIEAAPMPLNTAEDTQSNEINVESILEPAAAPREETSTTTIKEVKDEPIVVDTATGTKMEVSEDSGKHDVPVATDGKPEEAIALAKVQTEIKAEGDTVAQQEMESVEETAKVDDAMNTHEVKAEEQVKEEKEEGMSVEEDITEQIKEQPPAAVAKLDDVEPAPKMEEAKEEAGAKDQQDVKEEPTEEEPAPFVVEEKEDEKEIGEKPAVKDEEVGDVAQATTAEEENKATVKEEEEKEPQRPRSNSRTKRKKSDADANEKPLEEIESPRASRRQRKLILEEAKSPDKDEEEEESVGSPRSPGKRNKRRKRR